MKSTKESRGESKDGGYPPSLFSAPKSKSDAFCAAFAISPQIVIKLSVVYFIAVRVIVPVSAMQSVVACVFIPIVAF